MENDPRINREPSQETVRQGRLDTCLETEILPGFYLNHPDRPHYHEIPGIIDTVLATIAADPAVGEIYATGSIPKNIASGIHPFFWDYPASLRPLLSHPDISNDVKNTVIRRLVHGPTDMDAKLALKDGASSDDIFTGMAHGLDISDNNIRIDTIPLPDGTSLEQKSFAADWNDHYSVRAVIGPVPTNLKRRYIRFEIIDKATAEEAFHIDIGEFGLNDKRVGGTSKRQDTCKARLTVINGHVYYTLTREAADAMRDRDEIWIESDDPADVMEISGRSLRSYLLHGPQEYFRLNGFSGEYPSSTIFWLRHLVQTFQEEHKSFDRNKIDLLKSELALCITIDPYTTVQFLRDSQLYLLIPGLRHITVEMWNNILTSKAFVVAMSPGFVTARKRERTIGFMDTQRLAYRGTPPEDTDGMAMFIKALAEVRAVRFTNPEAHPWMKFDELFAEGLPVALEVMIGNMVIKSTNGRPVDLDALRQMLLIQERQITENHESDIRQYLISRGAGDEGQGSFIKADQIGYLIGVYKILERYPAGLTARELSGYYNREITDINKPQFKNLLLELKKAGVIFKETEKRSETTSHAEIDVDIYCLHRNGMPSIPAVNQIDRRKLEIFRAVYRDHTGTDADDPELLSRYKSIRANLSRYGINNFQFLQSLTWEDAYLLFKNRPPSDTFMADVALFNSFRQALNDEQ